MKHWTEGGAARRKPEPADSAAAVSERRQKRPQRMTAVLDEVIHERVRLGIVSALAGVEALSFKELKDMLAITDGNLSVHARRLEEAGFIVCHKSFVERVPRTLYRLTDAGRVVLDEYLNHMESLIRRVRES